MISRVVDWDKLLGDLEWLLGEPDINNPYVRKPISAQALADWLKVPRKTMLGWRDGSQPKHQDGEILIQHWCRLAGKGREFLPTTHVIFSASKVRGR
jgi:hypothetical protein